jgi:hypothetical protein
MLAALHGGGNTQRHHDSSRAGLYGRHQSYGMFHRQGNLHIHPQDVTRGRQTRVEEDDKLSRQSKCLSCDDTMFDMSSIWALLISNETTGYPLSASEAPYKA